MNDREYLGLLCKWYNEHYGGKRGRFRFIESVEIVCRTCGEDTGEWEEVILRGRGFIDGIEVSEKEEVLNSSVMPDFFRWVSVGVDDD